MLAQQTVVTASGMAYSELLRNVRAPYSAPGDCGQGEHVALSEPRAPFQCPQTSAPKITPQLVRILGASDASWIWANIAECST